MPEIDDDDPGTELEVWEGRREGHAVRQAIWVNVTDNTVAYHVVHSDSYHFTSYEKAKEFSERTRQRAERGGKLKLHKQTVTDSGE